MALLLIIWKEYHILLPAEVVPVFADLLRGLTLSNSTEKKEDKSLPMCFPPSSKQFGRSLCICIFKELRGRITRDASVVCLAVVAGFGQDLKLAASG